MADFLMNKVNKNEKFVQEIAYLLAWKLEFP